jgi:hypothetical protein
VTCELSIKNITISAVIIVSIVTFITLLWETYTTLQGINPIAVAAAVTVAVIGIAWFKKTST